MYVKKMFKFQIKKRNRHRKVPNKGHPLVSGSEILQPDVYVIGYCTSGYAHHCDIA